MNINTISQSPCRYCGSAFGHSGLCPSIEEIEYRKDGSIKRVKLRSPAGFWPQQSAPTYYTFGGEVGGLPDTTTARSQP